MVESGVVGLEIFECEMVDLVIFDMCMLEMDGVIFLKQVCGCWLQVMCILLMGYVDIILIVVVINEGEIYCYIFKFWDDNEIVLVVWEVFECCCLEEENCYFSVLILCQNEEFKEFNVGFEQKVNECIVEVWVVLNELKKIFLVIVQVFVGMVELCVGLVVI